MEGNNAIRLADVSIERQLEMSGSMTVEMAKRITIANNDDYSAAGAMLRSIKEQANKVKAYWADPKAKAAAAHKDICAREAAMLNPLKEAESIVKRSMAQYHQAIEQARLQQEEEERKLRQQEAERILNQAAEAEAAGDDQAAEIGLAMAEMVSDMDAPSTANSIPSADGISKRKTWKAMIEDPESVPAYYNGMEIRTINMTALNGIAKMTKGTANIPGIKFYEEISISVKGAK